MAIDIHDFGTTEHGEAAHLITLTNRNGVVMKVTTYGGAITELHLPDRDGRMADCVLGFDNLRQYETDSPSFGCCCGRVANRIRDGRFTLDGKTHQLPLNYHGKHHIHGGPRGFGKRVWSYTTHQTPAGPSVTFTHASPDGEEGYPGGLDATMTYTLTDDNALVLTYEATAAAPTIVNLTNHSYFNLAGCDAGVVMDHQLKINAETVTVVDDYLVPTGEFASALDGPFDFTEPKTIGRDIDQLADTPAHGYDVNYCLDNPDGDLVLAATCFDPTSGRIMHVYTDQPGMQLYTGNMLKETFGGKGVDVFRKHAGVCFETQKYADAINHPAFPSIVLRPGETYTHRCEYRFDVADAIE